MRIFREVIGGVVFAAVTTLTVIGGIGLAFIESDNSFFRPPITQVSSLLPTETLFVPSPVLPVSTSTPGPVFSPTPCTPPADWLPVTVGPNETLLGLASRSGINAQAISLANCLPADSVFAGQLIYLPAAAPAQQPTLIACGPPRGWIFYTVQPGENMFRISLRYGVSINEMLQANCLTSTNISAGQNLFVPPVSVIADTVPPPTFTIEPFTPTASATSTNVVSNPPAATDTATFTPVAPTARPPTSTSTPTVTHEVEATLTPTATAETSTPTETETPTPTPTPTLTETETSTPTETETPTPTPTDTETPTPTTPPPQ